MDIFSDLNVSLSAIHLPVQPYSSYLYSLSLRQHLKRRHSLLASNDTAKIMREKGKSLLCKHLHTQAMDSDYALSTSSEEVSRVLSVSKNILSL